MLQACREQLQSQSRYVTAEATRTLKESDAVSIVRLICRRFHAVVVQLQSQQRQALQINNEYDVQDILHALLELHFNNVRAKQPTPSFRGELSRTDFLLKNGQIVVEAKITRATLAEREVCFELREDAAHDKRHSDCQRLVCLVYDPQGFIKNPRGVESEIRKLSSASLGVDLIVVS
ncbi:MAG: hypothetical protein DMG70_02085 [Acidobacteria bacterium]|nr:MAG: hypothetical protein DMG70_02085 [Acidobacteriota bacterium]